LGCCDDGSGRRASATNAIAAADLIAIRDREAGVDIDATRREQKEEKAVGLLTCERVTQFGLEHLPLALTKAGKVSIECEPDLDDGRDNFEDGLALAKGREGG